MDWQQSLLGAFDNITALPVPRWLALTSLITSIVLLLLVLWLMAYAIRMRGRVAAGAAGDPSTASIWDEHLPSVSLEGEGNALIDRLLPRRPRPFLFAVFVICAGAWIVGLLMAERPEVFLADTEWQAQPIYLAAHFITLRMFATAFSRTFRAGTSHLDVAPETVRHRMWLVLGPLGVLIAAIVSVPFSLIDYPLLSDPTWDSSGRATDLLVFAIWCVEWFLIAFIWVMVVGYMILASSVISNHRFRDPIEVVLHERRYRPFLQMSGQGATIVLGFWVINIIYALITGAVFSDYAGAVVTLLLVVAGLVPPLLQLRAKVNGAVGDEMASMRRRVSGARPRAEAGGGGAAAAVADARSLESRLDEALVLLRMSYLERLHGQLGQTETTDIVIKLLVPATTMVWYGYKYYKGVP